MGNSIILEPGDQMKKTGGIKWTDQKPIKNIKANGLINILLYSRQLAISGDHNIHLKTRS